MLNTFYTVLNFTFGQAKIEKIFHVKFCVKYDRKFKVFFFEDTLHFL
jgi:hypothetical protein